MPIVNTIKPKPTSTRVSVIFTEQEVKEALRAYAERKGHHLPKGREFLFGLAEREYSRFSEDVRDLRLVIDVDQ